VGGRLESTAAALAVRHRRKSGWNSGNAGGADPASLVARRGPSAEKKMNFSFEMACFGEL